MIEELIKIANSKIAETDNENLKIYYTGYIHALEQVKHLDKQIKK